jgi:hypothetical protein
MRRSEGRRCRAPRASGWGDLYELRRREDGRDDGERLSLQRGDDVLQVVDPAWRAVGWRGADERKKSASCSRTYQVPLVHVTVMTSSARMVSVANRFVFWQGFSRISKYLLQLL